MVCDFQYGVQENENSKIPREHVEHLKEDKVSFLFTYIIILAKR